MSSALKRAYQIVIERSEEKERQYGDFKQSMKTASKFASFLLNKKITAYDVALIQVALKLARLKHRHKTDTIVDAIAYLGIADEINKDEDK